MLERVEIICPKCGSPDIRNCGKPVRKHCNKCDWEFKVTIRTLYEAFP